MYTYVITLLKHKFSKIANESTGIQAYIQEAAMRGFLKEGAIHTKTYSFQIDDLDAAFEAEITIGN